MKTIFFVNRRIWTQVHKGIIGRRFLHNSLVNRFSDSLEGLLSNKMAYKYNHSKYKPFNIYISISDVLDRDYKWEIVKEVLELGETYFITIKLNYLTKDNNYDYKTCGEQLLFKYNNENDLNNKLSVIVMRVSSFLDAYTIDIDQVEYIHLVTVRVKSEFLTDIKINKDTFTKNDRNFYKEMITKVPLTIDSDVLGTRLKTFDNDDNTIHNIIVDIDGKTFNFMDKINELNRLREIKNKEPIYFDNKFIFYLRGSSEKYFTILAVKICDNGSIIKQVYDFNTGDLITSSTDRIDSEDVIRTVGQKEITISRKENLVEFEKRSIFLSPIDRKKFLQKRRNLLAGEQTRFGVFDFETYIKNYNPSSENVSNKIAHVYAVGLYVKDMINEVIYIEPDFNSHVLVIKMFDIMFRSEFDGYIWYCHNFAKYDSFFVIGAVSWYNDNQKDDDERYKLYPVSRDGYPIKLTISKKVNNVIKRINLVDSLPILPDKLRNLAESFGTQHQKGYFPHSFVEENKLFYVGNIPSRSYFVDIDYDKYELIPNRTKWSLKDVAIEYCKYDNMALYDILTVANKRFYLDYNIQMTSSLTISKMALELYLVQHYKNNIPLINDRKLYNDIKQAYYGGCTEVYRPYGENLFYYDVNSLYPFVSLNDMPGKECTYIYSPNRFMDLDNLFGFFYCEIEMYDGYLGLLPYRSKQGLVFPIGRWSGWYFSEELKYAQENGYKIKVIKGYNFSREKNVFKSFIDTLYKKKVNAKDSVMKNITKLLLNSLLGRFGLNIFKDKTEIMDTKVYDKMSLVVSVKNERAIGNNNKYVTYTPGINIERCKENSIDIIKVKNKFNKLPGISENENLHKQVSIGISAAINSYARIYMAKIKKSVLDSKGQIYYSDTDSLVTDIELPPQLVSPTELGKFKLENKILKGYFISGKTYGILTDKYGKDNNLIFISKAKGVTEKVTLQHYELLYKGIDQEEIIKTSSIKKWDSWSVVLHELKVTIKHDAYKRRNKIYENGLWINTSPLVIDEKSNSGFAIIKLFDDEKSKKSVIKLDNVNSEKNVLSQDNVVDIHLFRWWYWSILPIAIIGYIFSMDYMEDDIDSSKNQLVENISTENEIDICYGVNENKPLTLWEKFFGKGIPNMSTTPIDEYKIVDNISIKYENCSTQHDNFISIQDSYVHECLNEIIRKNAKFNTVEDLVNFLKERIKNDNVNIETSNKIVESMKEKFSRDINFKKILVDTYVPSSNMTVVGSDTESYSDNQDSGTYYTGVRQKFDGITNNSDMDNANPDVKQRSDINNTNFDAKQKSDLEKYDPCVKQRSHNKFFSIDEKDSVKKLLENTQKMREEIRKGSEIIKSRSELDAKWIEMFDKRWNYKGSIENYNSIKDQTSNNNPTNNENSGPSNDPTKD